MTPVVSILLIATVGAYLLQMTAPALASLLVFFPPVALERPWTIVTYMFLHGGFTHILFNMIALFFFGPRVEARIGARPFAILYFLSGITGAVFSFFLAHDSPIIGASAGVFGVMLAFAHYWPRELVYIWGVIPVPARVLVILTTIITLWSGFGSVGSGIAHFAHLGGYAGAFLYLLWLERGRTRFKRKVAAAPPEATKRAADWK
ncbi:MAG TPA: rhomboid family intramembrane serine protease, partial [Gemmatimonadaceae bacterium]|nr:rhomboid family intramembrane serine protease [Gemmatimonadaceae bacterium]